MVKDQQIRRLWKLMQTEKTLEIAALKSGMSEKTARKYLKAGMLPSEMRTEREWITRENPFELVWGEIENMLSINSGLEAKTIFFHLQTKYPGSFQDGQLRTLQRHIKKWRALKGPNKEVYFPQIHYPGELCQSDFTHVDNLGITINKVPFKHLIYHFVLTYSNWETGSICYSESFESLSEGLQNAIWELGGVPKSHQTDRLSAAINNNCKAEEFTGRYKSLLNHYKLTGKKIQAGKANENGDVEQSHYRFKKSLEQSLMLRGSRNFNSLADYQDFLKSIFAQLNSGRIKRFQEELYTLKNLPTTKLEACKRYMVKVGPSSTININHNTYSVNSRLIGEKILVKLKSTTLDIWYGQKCIDTIPRLKGCGKSSINYRHIIDSLIRKPGAFENYRHKKDLFPTHRFRMAFDNLKTLMPIRCNKEYLKILYLAAYESEEKVDRALEQLINSGIKISYDLVKQIVTEKKCLLMSVKTSKVNAVDLHQYDQLLNERQAI